MTKHFSTPIPHAPEALAKRAWRTLRHALAGAGFAALAMSSGATLAAAGDLDASFGSGGRVTSAGATTDLSDAGVGRGLAVQLDGRILVAGTGSSGGFTVARYLVNGALDSSFGSGGVATVAIGSAANATSLALQADGRIVVAGFARINGQDDFAAARLTSSGALDTSFNTVGFVTTAISTVSSNGSPTDRAFGVALQADQKIVVVGSATMQLSNNQTYRDIAVVRYNPDGSPDAGFGPAGVRTTHIGGSGNSQESVAYGVAIQPDGKIVVVGDHLPSGVANFAVLRYHGLAATGTPGTLDAGFNGTGIVSTDLTNCFPCLRDDGARSVAIQADGKIVVAGYADNGVRNTDNPSNDTVDVNFGVLRLNPNGVRDPGFGAAGQVTTRVGETLPLPGTNAGPYARAFGVAIQADGRIVVAGESASSSNTANRDFALVRYTAVGDPDISFGAGGTGRLITPIWDGQDGGRAVAIHSDGNIVVAGFTAPDGFAVARYQGTPLLSATRSRDFNADGRSDIVWQSNVGDVAIWLMNGTSLDRGVAVGPGRVNTAWQIATSGDFNGDGKPDLVWQNTVTGERSIWFMDGSSYISAAVFAVVAREWQIVGSGDFNGDGKADIVWQNTSTGGRVIWLMNGTTLISGLSFGVVATDWNVVGVGDFNGDGRPDIVWQRNSGDLAVWLMNGTAFASGVGIGSVGPQWRVAGVGDFNGDGKTDIVFQNSTVANQVVWFMNGTNFVSGVSFANVPLAWRIAR